MKYTLLNKSRCMDRLYMRLCVVCGKQAVKGKYCQSCADFIRSMKERDQELA